MNKNIKYIIENTVKQVINELDWKTYQSAADKAERLANDKSLSPFERQRRLNQYNAFKKAAIDNLNKKYHTNDDEVDDIIKYIKNYDDYEIYGFPNNMQIPSNGKLKNLDKRSKELDDFFQGNYQYKDNNWQLENYEDNFDDDI